MRKYLGLFLALLVAGGFVVTATASASPSRTETGSYFGDGNLPPGCIVNRSPDNPNNKCFHGKVGLNALDSSEVDVLVLVPASPVAERDFRIMRQAIEMWEQGLDYLAKQENMAWVAKTDFHISGEILDGGELSTYPLYDPEIVVLATNPVGGIGIGVDPVNLLSQLELIDSDGVPCHNIQNPFSLEMWQGLPGFDSHHDPDSGVYVEDCGGAGGNTCFAINGAIDPVPGMTEVFGIFDLITHEVGHCLTLGHVGDGAEGSWGPVPTNDIMSYNEDPPGLSKCVSSLNLEGFAIRMSHYVDRNGDGKVTKADWLEPNDVAGDGANSFQVQAPSDHVYASATGAPKDCPQPDVGLVPGTPVNWGPTAVTSTKPVLKLTSPRAGATGRTLRVAGSVGFARAGKKVTKSTASFRDRTGDARSPFNDIEDLSVRVTNTSVEATVSVARLWPTTAVTSPSAYSLIINGQRFDSFVAPGETAVTTWDNGAEKYMTGVASTWDPAANTVRFKIPRRYLEGFRNVAPYYVGATASVQNAKRVVFVDDTAPQAQNRIAATGRPLAPVTPSGNAFNPPLGKPYVVSFKADGGNEFSVTNTNLGESLVADNTPFAMEVSSPSNVEITLAWDDANSDLDVTAVTAGAEETVRGEGGNPRVIRLKNVVGPIDLEVAPFFVSPTGTKYTLKAKVTPIGKDSDGDGITNPGDSCQKERGPAPTGCPDADRDGVPNKHDKCRNLVGHSATGCPPAASEWIKVLVDGKVVRTSRDRPGARHGPVRLRRAGAAWQAHREGGVVRQVGHAHLGDPPGRLTRRARRNGARPAGRAPLSSCRR